jgi:hypothetical protein
MSRKPKSVTMARIRSRLQSAGLTSCRKLAVRNRVAHDSDITSRALRRYPFSRNRLDPGPQYAEPRRNEPVCRV